MSKKYNGSGIVANDNRGPEDSFAFDDPTIMKRTEAESGLDGYPNTLDYATSELKKSGRHSTKGTIINKYDHTGKKACCDPCSIF